MSCYYVNVVSDLMVIFTNSTFCGSNLISCCDAKVCLDSLFVKAEMKVCGHRVLHITWTWTNAIKAIRHPHEAGHVFQGLSDWLSINVYFAISILSWMSKRLLKRILRRREQICVAVSLQYLVWLQFEY